MPHSDFAAVLVSPIGKLGLKIIDDHLLGVDFVPEETKAAEPVSLLAKEAALQLHAYFSHKLTVFDLPLLNQGTAFQQIVLTGLLTIPYGKTLTYGELGKKLSTGPRAIGNACRRNPFPIIIPCHRVVAQTGLGGYSGARLGKWLTMKKWLLQHEKNGI